MALQHPSTVARVSATADSAKETPEAAADPSTLALFDDFVEMLQQRQKEIIATLQDMDGSGRKFCNDTWGIFNDNDSTTTTRPAGGMTCVLQGGNVIEKGACSVTLIRQGILSGERAASIRVRQGDGPSIQAGDTYKAAALSIVLHSKSPMVPTFRSDVRIFVVTSSQEDEQMAWFGGGADLTPYYLFEEDIIGFHKMYRDLCEKHLGDSHKFSYETMKKTCDDYFYLPARSEHRGTGGIFFDDMEATEENIKFVEGVVNTWMPSWLPIVDRRRNMKYKEKQRHWQLLRRGRYLEFNLLADKGVKFGLASANPRVEGVMVSAPPLVAWEYNHVVEEGSDEAKLVEILKKPRNWLEN